MIAVAAGGGTGATGVGAGFGFGEGPRADLPSLREWNEIFLLLRLSAEFVDVIRAERIVRGDNDANGSVYAGKLFDGDDVLDVAEASATVLLGKNDAEEAHFGELRHDFEREMGDFIPLHDVRRDFAFGKFADAFAELLLLIGKGEIHAAPGE